MAGPEAAVELSPSLREKGNEFKQAVDECNCPTESLAGMCRICLKCGKLRDASNTGSMADEDQCLACGLIEVPKCALQPMYIAGAAHHMG